MKKLFFIILCFILIIAFCGCTTVEGPEKDEKNSSRDKTEVRLSIDNLYNI